MKLTIELTLYPLQDDYLPPIKAMVDWLHRQSEIKVSTHATCTILCGEYDVVMEVLKRGVEWSVTEYGKCVFVAKLLPGVEALSE